MYIRLQWNVRNMLLFCKKILVYADFLDSNILFYFFSILMILYIFVIHIVSNIR